ncbi:hypothetical protein, partial [Halomonas sp. 141]|uniref:hypothetical protein n=1 Tax=Halomonas sp. 141 TaxID=2056666 RepID=UPI001E355F31
LHGANDQKVLAGGDRESVGAGFTDSGITKPIHPLISHEPNATMPPKWTITLDHSAKHYSVLGNWEPGGPPV